MLLVLFVQIPAIKAQEIEEMAPCERIYLGGDLSLQLGTTTFIEVAPLVGYRFFPRFSSGVGVTYQYYQDNTFRNDVFKTHSYGGRIISKYLLIRHLHNAIPLGVHFGLAAYGEYELLNMDNWYSNINNAQEGRFWLHSVYFGGGLEMPVSRNVSINFFVLFNLNDTGESPYTDPVVRIGPIFSLCRRK